MFILGIALIMAPLGLLIPDLSYFSSLLTLLLLFVSPIGFMATMLSTKLKLVVWSNPIYYLLAPFRAAFLPGQPIKLSVIAIAIGVSIFVLLLGLIVFNKFKQFVMEYD